MKKIIGMILSLAIMTSVFPIGYAADEVVNEQNGDSIGIYVATDGSDKNPGTINEPLATLEGAKATVRSYLKQGADKPINVYIRGGEYRVYDGVEFTEADSGTENAEVTYQAYNDEEVSFIGSRKISSRSFSPVTDKTVLEKIPQEARQYVGVYDLRKLGIDKMEGCKVVPGYGAEAYDQEVMTPPLYLNGKEQTLARYPNGFNNYIDLRGNIKSTNSFGYKDNIADAWVDAPHAVVVGGMGATWAWERGEVENIDAENKIITLKKVPSGSLSDRGQWAIENLIEVLDIPGEYYIDEDNMLLYWYPPYSVKEAELEIAIDSFCLITMNEAEHISFKNIGFKNFRKELLKANNCKSIGFYGCDIKNITGNCMWFKECRDCTIDGCDMAYIGGGGIRFESAINSKQLIAENNVINNCRIHSVSQKQKSYCSAVTLTGVGDTITNCVLYDSPHMLVGINGNDHKFLYNECYDGVKEMVDSGALYMLRNLTYGGNEIAYNYFHDINAQTTSSSADTHQSRAMYFDDAVSGVHAHHNVFDNVQQAFQHGGGSTNNIHDNMILNGEHGSEFDTRGAGWMRNTGMSMVHHLNEMLKDAEAAAAYSKYENLDKLYGLAQEYGALWPFFTHVDNNLFYKNTIDPVWGKGGYIAEHYSSKDNNIITRSKEEYGIEFVNEEMGDYTIKEGSPILDKIPGLAEIDLSKIGIYKSEYRDKTEYEMDDFKQYYPKNNLKEMTNLGSYAVWEQCDNASFYKVTVAKDPEFKNIVGEYECNYNFVDLSNLETGFVDHYWRVEAIDNGMNVKASKIAKNEKSKFTTTEYDVYDKTDMYVAMEDARRFVSELSEGNEAGQVVAGTVAPIKKALEEAERVDAIEHVSQQQIDEATEVLNNSMSDVASNVHKYYTDIDYAIKDAKGWKNNFKEATIENTSDGALKYFKETTEGTVTSYVVRPVDKTKIMSFKLKTDVGTMWTGIALQNEPVQGNWIWSDSKRLGFLVVFKQDIIELQKWGKNGQEIYTVNNTVLKSNEEANVDFGVINFGAGNRMILNINGINMFDMIDYTSPINEDLYLSLYNCTSTETEATYLSSLDKLPENEVYSGGVSGELLGINDIFGKNEINVSAWEASEERIANNSSVDFELTRSADNESTKLLFKQNSSDTQTYKTDGAGYELSVTDNGIVLSRYKQGRMQIVAAAENKYALKGTTSNIKLNEYTVKDGLKIQLIINGEEIINVTDFYPVKSAGYFAIGVDGGSVSVK